MHRADFAIFAVLSYQLACPLDAVPPGSVREIKVAGRALAICQVESEIHALEGICPHRGGPLGQGTLEGHALTCPWHAWTFDVRTGACINNPASVRRIPARVDGANILVKLG